MIYRPLPLQPPIGRGDYWEGWGRGGVGPERGGEHAREVFPMEEDFILNGFGSEPRCVCVCFLGVEEPGALVRNSGRL